MSSSSASSAITDRPQHPLPPEEESTNDVSATAASKWKGSIRMKMDQNGDGTLEEFDLCDFVGQKYVLNPPKLYFDRSRFPPPLPGITRIPKDEPTFKELQRTLRETSIRSGSPLTCNGSKCGKRIFVCAFCSRTEPPKTAKEGARQRNTGKVYALAPGKCCSFKLMIYWDRTGYFLHQKAGNAFHSNHPKIDPSTLVIPKSLIRHQTAKEKFQDQVFELFQCMDGLGNNSERLENEFEAFLGKKIAEAKRLKSASQLLVLGQKNSNKKQPVAVRGPTGTCGNKKNTKQPPAGGATITAGNKRAAY
jgi:hypothetical protein